jgi:hypothetical protein
MSKKGSIRSVKKVIIPSNAPDNQKGENMNEKINQENTSTTGTVLTIRQKMEAQRAELDSEITRLETQRATIDEELDALYELRGDNQRKRVAAKREGNGSRTDWTAVLGKIKGRFRVADMIAQDPSLTSSGCNQAITRWKKAKLIAPVAGERGLYTKK